jgi:p-hydroxybenzoate 3-monooxygenase
VLEARSRERVEQRIRAGVLEQGTVDLLDATGVGGRMRQEGLVHHGIEQFDGERHRSRSVTLRAAARSSSTDRPRS